MVSSTSPRRRQWSEIFEPHDRILLKHTNLLHWSLQVHMDILEVYARDQIPNEKGSADAKVVYVT